MKLKHKVCIKITEEDGRVSPVITSGSAQVRKRLLRFLLGDKMNVLVISPEDSVQSVEIHELKGGDGNEAVRSGPGDRGDL